MTLKLAVGLPAYRGQICAAQSIMWAQFGAAVARQPDDVQIVMFAHVDTCGIDRARNALVRQAIVAKADWLLSVDSDTFAVAGKDLLRMILERPADAAAVGAAVIRRGETTRAPNVWRWTGERHEVGIVGSPPYAEVDAIGAAILAINVHVIERLGARFEWVSGMSEDLAMCRKLRVAGEKIYVDPRVATVHLGQSEILAYSPPT
jgi:GT2 family glycosyltransferase